MGASVGNKEDGAPMAEINVTPLVDVMLVLLIIFMITTPLMNHKVKGQRFQRRWSRRKRKSSRSRRDYHPGDRNG